MGRKRWVNTDLPEGVRRRVNKDGTHRYYLDRGGRQIPLGSDYLKALQSAQGAGPQTIASEFACWQQSEDFADLSENTRYTYERAIVRLAAVFGEAGFEDIGKPELVKYLRLSKTRKLSRNDIGCLSSMWSWAEREGRTAVANPRLGLELKTRKKDRREQTGVTPQELAAVKAKIDPMSAYALDLLYLSGQDVGVVLGWKRADVNWDEGVLDTTRRKTRHPIRILLYHEGELTQFGKTLRAALDHPRRVGSLSILSAEGGEPLTYKAFWQRFNVACKKAGVHFELRAIRRQTATDATSLTAAQELLGHSDTGTTRKHYRRGEKVRPLK